VKEGRSENDPVLLSLEQFLPEQWWTAGGSNP
jgi:hypothetical protein